MALTEKRRNEIARLFCANKLASKPLRGYKRLGEEIRGCTTMNSTESVHLATFLLELVVGKFVTGLTTVNVVLHNKRVSGHLDHLDAFCFELVVGMKHKEGIKIGDLVKRQVGNEAKQLGITTDEAVEFAKEVVTEIVKKTFA